MKRPSPATTTRRDAEPAEQQEALPRDLTHSQRAQSMSQRVATLGWLLSNCDLEGLEVDDEHATHLCRIGYWLEDMGHEIAKEVYLDCLANRPQTEAGGAR